MLLQNAKQALTVVVASENPVKINAAKMAFSAVTQGEVLIKSINVASGVSDQPMNTEETYLGAETRVDGVIAESARKGLQVDYYIAYEGGVDVFEDGPRTFAAICISDGNDKVYGQSATLPLPVSVYEQLLVGVELGTAMDKLFNTENIKQKGGAIGQLTGGLETRLTIYKSATILALSRFMHAHLFN